jgi:hypothetical protein
MGTVSKRSAARRTAALRALEIGHGYARTAEAIGISQRLFETWRRDDPEFGRQCYEARERAIDLVENRLYNDALDGNTLSQLAYLRAHRPQLYHRRQLVMVEGNPDNPLVVQQGDGPAPEDPPVRFYMPPNRRDEPAADIGTIETIGPLEIEGEASDDTEAA